MTTETTDDALVRSARSGSREAAAELFDRHWRTVWRASFAIAHSREVAEDCAQDAFVRALASLEGYRGPSFRAWVSRIAINLTLNQMRRDRRLTTLADEGGEWEMDLPDTSLERALAGLSLDHRAIVVLRYWLDYSPAEIAPLLDLPVGTVHSRLARALARLREDLEVEDAGRA